VTDTSTSMISAVRPRVIAERAATTRLLNAFLRETRADPPTGRQLRVPLPESGCVLLGGLQYRSLLGHHHYGDDFAVDDGSNRARPVGHDELVALLLTELTAVASRTVGQPVDQRRRRAELAAQIDNSVARTSRYLQRTSPRPSAADPRALTRHAEQSLLFGHPFHPTPKSAEGFSADDLAAYAPELGAEFPLHYVAVAPQLFVEERIAPDPWDPPEVERRAQRLLGPDRPHRLLPVHPWQADHLQRTEAFAALVADGAVVPLGPIGTTVYPTSSVRTVCDPTFPTAWKLPLHVRITNFVRTNPAEHARRATDAGRLVGALRSGWNHDGFAVLLETGYRTVAAPALVADLTVLYRENPFATRPEAPQVVAGLLEEHADGAEPALIGCLRQATSRPDGPLPAADVDRWLRRYLQISLLPVLAVFSADGVSLEAHVQNSLLHVADGWPARFYVRDMEGTSVSRQRAAAEAVPADSPLLLDDAEAWLRLRYYVLTNHVGHLVHVLARHTEADEAGLWRVVRQLLRSAPPDRYLNELLCAPTLPAKANLTSRFAERGEHPLYVDVPNPMQEPNR
jgi:L-2,3-diaminopropanoate---citrate ligase